MHKKVSKPFGSVPCGSWQPADYNSPHIQACQQFLIKDLTISDSPCILKFTWQPLTNTYYVSTLRRQQRRWNDFMKNSNIWYTLRKIIVSSIKPIGQLSSSTSSNEGSHRTPEGELLKIICAHYHSSYFIPTVWSWRPWHNKIAMWKMTKAKNMK